MMKILLDTDLGDDIDDALAIALCAVSPEIELVGVTTVFGNTSLRSKLARKLLNEFGCEEIEVITGIGKPLVKSHDCKRIPAQFDLLEEEKEQILREDAVSYMLEKVRKDKQLKVVAIGPLTNIATAIILDPEAMEEVELILMGGMIQSAYPEWNIMNDPEAAKIVFESKMKITMIGLDVTLQCRINDNELERIIKSQNRKEQFLANLTQKWMSESKHHPILHDPLVIGYLIDPTLLTLKDANIKIETKGEHTSGVTIDCRDVFGHTPLETINCQVAVDVNRDAFMDLFFNRVF